MLSENTWQISGSALISDVEEALSLSIGNGESETINGFVLGMYGSIPEDGTSFDVSTDTLDICVQDIKDHKIEKAVITVKTPEEDAETVEANE